MKTTYQPKALTTDQLSALSQAVKQALTDLYGERLDRVISFGSYARGDFYAESDVDYMVVLNDEKIDTYQEIRYMVDKVYDLSDAGFCKTNFTKKYLHSGLFLYQNARYEGKPV